MYKNTDQIHKTIIFKQKSHTNRKKRVCYNGHKQIHYLYIVVQIDYTTGVKEEKLEIDCLSW